MVPIQPFLDNIHRVLLYLFIFMIPPTHGALVIFKRWFSLVAFNLSEKYPALPYGKIQADQHRSLCDFLNRPTG